MERKYMRHKKLAKPKKKMFPIVIYDIRSLSDKVGFHYIAPKKQTTMSKM